MIILKISKDKLIAIINGITAITGRLRADLPGMKYDMGRAQVNAHLYILDDLSRKMRSKLVMMENKHGKNTVRFSVNEIQALILITYKDICTQAPYSMATLQEISDPIFQRLLQ